MCRPPFSTLLGAINVPAAGSASTTKRPTYRPSDPAQPKTANVPVAGSGCNTNGQCNGRQIWLHRKRPTYRPLDPAPPQTANVPAVGSGSTPNGQRTGRSREQGWETLHVSAVNDGRPDFWPNVPPNVQKTAGWSHPYSPTSPPAEHALINASWPLKGLGHSRRSLRPPGLPQ